MTKKWEKEYPLNTFKGETKKELINFIKSKLKEKDKKTAEMAEKLIGEAQEITGMENESVYFTGLGRNQKRDEIIKILKSYGY